MNDTGVNHVVAAAGAGRWNAATESENGNARGREKGSVGDVKGREEKGELAKYSVHGFFYV